MVTVKPDIQYFQRLLELKQLTKITVYFLIQIQQEGEMCIFLQPFIKVLKNSKYPISDLKTNTSNEGE